MRIGEFVVFTSPPIPSDPRRNLPDEPVDYPGLIYNIINEKTLGLYVFTHERMEHFRHVPYCKERKPNTWREFDAS